MESHETFCPALLDCMAMTAVTNDCPNLAHCLANSPLNRKSAMRLYYLNKGINPEYIRVERISLQLSPTLQKYIPTTNFTYNTDYPTRDAIIFGMQINWEEVGGGAKNFYYLTLEKLYQLIEHNFALITEKHNESPSIGDFFTFAEIQAVNSYIFTFEGYAIMPRRCDYRISLDGIVFNGDYSPQLLADFRDFVGVPDELSIEPNYLRAWWD